MFHILRLKSFRPALLFVAILPFLSLPASRVSAANCANLFVSDTPSFAGLKKLATKTVAIKDPLPVSSFALATAEKTFYSPAGTEVGRALVFELIGQNVQQFNPGSENLKLYRTEIDAKNRVVFEQLGFAESFDLAYGRFMSEVPNPALFEYLRARFNEKMPTHLRIHAGVYASPVVSAHQTEIVRNWVESARLTFGNPLLGSVGGLSPSQLAAPVINGRERMSTYRHDWEHFGSILLVTEKVVETNRLVGRFWRSVLERMREVQTKSGSPQNFRETEEFRAIMDAVYIYTRRFHSLTHVLGMLARNGGVIDVNRHRIEDFGQSARDETPTVHWVGLGFKPRWVTEKDLPFQNRLFSLSLADARVPKYPITVADAYAAVTNDAILQATAFASSHSQHFPDSALAKELRDILSRSGVSQISLLTREELQRQHDLTLDRLNEMGRSARKIVAAENAILGEHESRFTVERSPSLPVLKVNPLATQSVVAERLKRIFASSEFRFLPTDSLIAITLARDGTLHIASSGLTPDQHGQLTESFRDREGDRLLANLPTLFKNKYFEIGFKIGTHGRRESYVDIRFARDVTFSLRNQHLTGFGTAPTALTRPYIEGSSSPLETIRRDLMGQRNIQETFATCALAAVQRVFQARGLVTSEKELLALIGKFGIKSVAEFFGPDAGLGMPEVYDLLQRLGPSFGFTVKQIKASEINDFATFNKLAALAAEANTTDVIVNFGSPEINRPGGGHFAPIGGYNKTTKEVLLSEVNMNLNPPVWVGQAALIAAMKAEGTGGTSRGYLVIDWSRK